MDCEWGEWTVGGCQATCGVEHTYVKTRKKKVEASNRGRECTGADKKVLPCNLEKCAGKISPNISLLLGKIIIHI